MKFDFRRQLKGLNINELMELHEYHLEYMLKFLAVNSKESRKHFRYVGYIKEAIKKIK